MSSNPFLIDADELNAIRADKNTKILDGSWYLPNQPRDPKAEFKNEHIPGAVYFDIDIISDPDSNLPHMMPSAAKFSSSVEQLGLSNRNRIVVYDGMGLFSAARVWWMFRAFGHQNIQVLNGGLPSWKGSGFAVTNQPTDYEQGQFNAELNTVVIANMEDMRNNCQSQTHIVLDARTQARFDGEAPEPRPELSSGHMPGTTCLPFTNLMTGNQLKSVDELRAIFDLILNNAERPIITTCGSGVTAAIITLALSICGYGLQKLYDGSWTEWASNPDNPIEKNNSS